MQNVELKRTKNKIVTDPAQCSIYFKFMKYNIHS